MKRLVYYILLVLALGGFFILAYYNLAEIYEVTALKVVAGVMFLVGAVPLGLDAIFAGKIFGEDK